MASRPKDTIDRQILISKDDIILLWDQKLGKGSYGKVFTRVFKAKYRGSSCAAKEIDFIQIKMAYTLEKLQEIFIRACSHCSNLNHPNIVRFIGIYHPPQKFCPVMIMELMDESLTNYARTNVSFMNKISILHDVAEGLCYLHSRINPPFIHGDLSPNNILLKHLPACSVAKIANVGIARVISDVISSQELEIAGFMPLEKLAYWDTSIDVFSYGGIIFHTINGEWPESTKAILFDQSKQQFIICTKVEHCQEYLDKMTEEAKALKPLVLSCLDNDPVKRPTIFEACARIKAIKVC